MTLSYIRISVNSRTTSATPQTASLPSKFAHTAAVSISGTSVWLQSLPDKATKKNTALRYLANNAQRMLPSTSSCDLSGQTLYFVLGADRLISTVYD